MKSKQYPSQNEIKEWFEYRNGGLYRKKILVTRCKINERAGAIQNNGYRLIHMAKKRFLEHRLIWIYFNGDIPNDMIVDHINGNKDDNRIENLRVVSRSINILNQKSINVYPCDGGFRVIIQFNHNRINKRFDNYDEAKKWAIEKKSEIFEELGLTFHMD